jgi:flagellum-specific peptidoglycan hydrolase FlgJ
MTITAGRVFRVYSSAEESYIDHSEFLVNGHDNRDLFRLTLLITRVGPWPEEAGYATDPKVSSASYPENRRVPVVGL